MKIALAAAMLLLAATGAKAAVSVIGNGVAHNCFVAAEFGTDVPAGVALCSKALKEDVLSKVDRAATLINRAILRARSADMDGALTDYALAIATGEKLGDAYTNRAATLIALKRYADALRDADEAVRLGGGRIEIAYYNRGLANEALGHFKAAYDDYAAALKAEPRFAAAADSLKRFRLVERPD